MKQSNEFGNLILMSAAIKKVETITETDLENIKLRVRAKQNSQNNSFQIKRLLQTSIEENQLLENLLDVNEQHENQNE